MKQYNKEAAGGGAEDFRERVFRVARKIPYGKTTTYKNIAIAIHRPRAARAVGNALNKNRSPHVPCHRVVRSDGVVGGYAYGNKKKISILKKEGVLIRNGRVVDKNSFYLFK